MDSTAAWSLAVGVYPCPWCGPRRWRRLPRRGAFRARGRTCGSFLLMDNHTVLVLSADLADPDLKLLEQLPPETNIAVGNSVEAFERLAADADVILSWSASGKLLREVFAMCPKVRWVHSRSAGLDTVLFPELVGEPGAPDQRARRLQPVAGRVCAGRDSVFRQGFPAHDPQPGGRPLGAVRYRRRSPARRWALSVMATSAARSPPACAPWECGFWRSSGTGRHCTTWTRWFNQIFPPAGRMEMIAQSRLHRGGGAADAGDSRHDRRG